MRKALLVTAALGPLALAPLLGAGAQAAPNLVQNGGFEMNTLPATLNPPDASGAEIDSNWNYTGGRPSVCQAAIRVALISLRRCVMSVKTSLAR